MTPTSRLHFSPVRPIRPIRSRLEPAAGGDRLMLGLTARHVRRDTISVAPVAYPAARPNSGLHSASAVLDRLSAPLTRYHD